MPVNSVFTELASELEGQQLVQNRIRLFREDATWRDKQANFRKITDLYEAKTSDTDTSGIPRVNLIRRGVEDYLSVAMNNVPTARLGAERFVPPSIPEPERSVRLEVIQETERVMNSYVQTILEDNQYNDKVQMAIRQAAIYGVGYLMIDVDRSADLRDSFALRDLMSKDPETWTEQDVQQFDLLSKRISIQHVDSRDVFYQNGIRRHDGKMMRVSMIERFETQALRDMTGNQNIMAGVFPYFVDKQAESEESSNTTAMLTTWQLEPAATQIVMGEDDETGEVVGPEVTDWILVKTVIAGGQLLEKTVTSSDDGSLRLPIVPFYLRESEDHPYGFSIPLMLELSEKFINTMRTIIFKSARKAVSSQGVLIFTGALGPADKSAINTVLEEGGVGELEGNTLTGVNDIREMVMPLNYNASPINPALIQAMQMELDVFQAQSQTIDLDAVSDARTGSAKRAQINVQDRPKTISISLLSRAVEDVYDSIYELVRVHHTSQIDVAIQSPNGGRDMARLNEPFQRRVPEFDDQGSPILDETQPEGIAMRDINVVMNDTGILLKAQSSGRGSLPLDMISRFQILTALAQAGVIMPDTVRELTLEDEIKAIDDMMRNKIQAAQSQLQEAFGEQGIQTPNGDGANGTTLEDGADEAREQAQSVSLGSEVQV